MNGVRLYASRIRFCSCVVRKGYDMLYPLNSISTSLIQSLGSSPRFLGTAQKPNCTTKASNIPEAKTTSETAAILFGTSS
ncbi:hypothetical protein TNCV_997551 [Trichonephila clavipes]|nr:hypothetical protein TNCV_997551 [Trichonephila clavipes]